MASQSFLPPIDIPQLQALIAEDHYDEAFDLLVQPVHEVLYQRQTFELLAELTIGQRMMLCFDYLRMQVSQGGFIQLIQNGYVSLLVPVIEGLQHYRLAPEMVPVLDDVLKVYVLNKEALGRETTVEEFSKLYEEFQEFEELDRRFGALQKATMKAMLDTVIAHPKEFGTPKEA